MTGDRMAAGHAGMEIEAILDRAAEFLHRNRAKGLPVFVWASPFRFSVRDTSGAAVGRVWSLRIGLGQAGWCGGTACHLHFNLPSIQIDNRVAAVDAINRLLARFDPGAIIVIAPPLPVGLHELGGNTTTPTSKKISRRYMNANHFARFQRANRANRRVYKRGGPTLG